jgi:hypothetical protein
METKGSVLCFEQHVIVQYPQPNKSMHSLQHYVFKTYFNIIPSLTPKGTRIVQEDSGSDSDSESRRQSAQRMSSV